MITSTTQLQVQQWVGNRMPHEPTSVRPARPLPIARTSGREGRWWSPWRRRRPTPTRVESRTTSPLPHDVAMSARYMYLRLR